MTDVELSFLLTNSFFDEVELISARITFSLLIELELLIDVATDDTLLISEEDELLCSLELLELDEVLSAFVTELELLELTVEVSVWGTLLETELLELTEEELEVLSAFVTELELEELDTLELEDSMLDEELELEGFELELLETELLELNCGCSGN